MSEVVGHLINGREVPSASGETFATVAPGSGQVLGEVALGGVQDVEAAATAAATAFEDGRWQHLPAAERARRMRTVADLLNDHADELARIEAQDSGAPLSKAAGDVAGAAGSFTYFSQLPEHVSGRTYAADQGYLLYSRRVPYGVVGAIAPWNFPLLLAAWKTAPALAVGNSVILKMAEQTPLSTALFAKICLEAGIPDGVINVVHGDGRTGAALVRHPLVPKITFTGSTDVGKQILRDSADHIKSVHLELGGKSPNLVFADADLDQAIEGSLFTSFFNSGQVCTSSSRILVEDRIADEFRARFVERVGRLTVGDPLDPATQLGPLVSQAQQQRVAGFVDSGKQQGATVLAGGAAPDPNLAGFFVTPTVFGDVTADMRIFREEIFGPVATIIPFADEAQAVHLANDTEYGLAATVWTTNLARAMRMSEQLAAGIIWTNCPNHGQWNVPYEGHKVSGLGQDKGLECIDTFTHLKTHHVNFGGHTYNWA